MMIKFIGTLFFMAALFGPLEVIAKDTTTDSIGEYADDATITTKVKAAIAADKLVKGRDISVRTDHGVVDLTGTVKQSRTERLTWPPR